MVKELCYGEKEFLKLNDGIKARLYDENQSCTYCRGTGVRQRDYPALVLGDDKRAPVEFLDAADQQHRAEGQRPPPQVPTAGSKSSRRRRKQRRKQQRKERDLQKTDPHNMNNIIKRGEGYTDFNGSTDMGYKVILLTDNIEQTKELIKMTQEPEDDVKPRVVDGVTDGEFDKVSDDSEAYAFQFVNKQKGDYATGHKKTKRGVECYVSRSSVRLPKTGPVKTNDEVMVFLEATRQWVQGTVLPPPSDEENDENGKTLKRTKFQIDFRNVWGRKCKVFHEGRWLVGTLEEFHERSKIQFSPKKWSVRLNSSGELVEIKENDKANILFHDHGDIYKPNVYESCTGVEERFIHPQVNRKEEAANNGEIKQRRERDYRS